MSIEQLQYERNKTLVRLAVLDACSEWSKEDKPSTEKLEAIIDRATDRVMNIVKTDGEA